MNDKFRRDDLASKRNPSAADLDEWARLGSNLDHDRRPVRDHMPRIAMDDDQAPRRRHAAPFDQRSDDYEEEPGALWVAAEYMLGTRGADYLWIALDAMKRFFRAVGRWAKEIVAWAMDSEYEGEDDDR